MDALTTTPSSSSTTSTTTKSTAPPNLSSTALDASNHSKTNKNDGQTKNKKKRGLKPRSQRNRKRPRGGVGILNFTQSHEGECTSTIEEDQEYKVQIEIRPLELQQNANPSSSTTTTTKKRIRIVQPYPFTYSTFAKARWNKRTILDVYSTEFGSYPKTYYENAISNGRITVSGKKVSCDYIIKGGDELSHVVHRHEPAVAICDASNEDDDKNNDGNDHKKHIDIIHEDDEIIVVDKPPTVPVHPCGGYNFNSLFYILSDQNPTLEGKLHNVHRLDRLTSGLTIIAKSTNVAKVLGKCINDRDQCYKVYLARVKGKFPLNAPTERQLDLAQMKNEEKEEKGKPPIIKNGEWIVDFDESMKEGKIAETFWITNNNDEFTPSSVTLNDVFTSRIDPKHLTHEGRSKTTNETNDDTPIYWLNLACPCEIICHKNGICKAGTNSGKAAQTAFAVVNYDEDTDTSIVLAKPLTGRTHQIRLHLQYLGHPIANDPNYGGDMFYANEKGLELCQKAQQKMDHLDKTFAESNKKNCTPVAARPTNAISTDIPASEEEIEQVNMLKREDCTSFLEYLKKSCVWCARNRGEDRTMLEFLVRSPGLWLHSYQYSLKGPNGKQMCHSTSLPDWCNL